MVKSIFNAIRWSLVNAFRLIVRYVIRIVDYTLRLIVTAISSIWLGIPFTTQKLADVWTKRLLQVGIPNQNEAHLYSFFVSLAFSMIVTGWVILAFITVGLVMVIFRTNMLMCVKVGCFQRLMEKNTMRTIPKERYLELSQVFHWATKQHYILMLTPKIDRHRRTEVMLPRLVRKGKLTATYYGKKLVYCALRKNRKRICGSQYYPTIAHGLACTEALVRFSISDPNCEVIGERYLRGFKIVPEWAILYPNKKLLLFEFCTKDNFKRRAVFKSKSLAIKITLMTWLQSMEKAD